MQAAIAPRENVKYSVTAATGVPPAASARIHALPRSSAARCTHSTTPRAATRPRLFQ